MQAERKRAAQRPAIARQPAGTKPGDVPESGRKRKRTARPEDEIEALFDATVGKKTKKGALGADNIAHAQSRDQPFDLKGGKDKGLQEVIGAIRAAPKAEKYMKKK